MASKVTEYTGGKKRVLEISLANGSTMKLKIVKATKYETTLSSNTSLSLEKNQDGTYRISFGSGLLGNLDDIVSIKLVKQDFE